MTIIAALPFPACVRQLHSSGAVLTKSNYGGLYPAHIRTTSIQKAMLAVGSGVAALSDPYRHGKWRTFYWSARAFTRLSCRSFVTNQKQLGKNDS